MFAHFAGDMGQDFVLIVVQHDPEHRAWQNRFNDAFQFDGLLYAHIGSMAGPSVRFPTIGFKLATENLAQAARTQFSNQVLFRQRVCV
jgi:hypothetical protein